MAAPLGSVAQGVHELPHVTALVGTQPEPQRRYPALQAKSQLLPTPQVTVAFAGAVQATQLWPQARKPGVQVKPQLVPLHVATPLAGATQVVHEVPQLVGLELGTHCWPHACWLAGHEQELPPQLAPIGQSAVN